jgi:hypothetical protein
MTLNPSPAQIVAAIKDHGVPLRLYRGWDTRGLAWAGDGSAGLLAVMNHHTATASATGATGAPSLEWCVTATSRGACNLLVGRGREDVWLITAGSAFHSGNGGPWPALGIGVGNTLHRSCFGIEIDDPGVRVGSMTDTQVEMVGRINAALMDLCGWGADRVVTHQSWTDGLDGVNPGGRSPYVGRKNDTLRGDGVGPYSATFWRANAAKYTCSGSLPVVSLARLLRGLYAETRQVHIALNAVGIRCAINGRWDAATQAAYDRFRRERMGLSGTASTGAPGVGSLTALGLAAAARGFRAVP